MLTYIIGWFLDLKTILQSISLADIVGVAYVGPNLTFWDATVIILITGSLISIICPSAEDEEED